MTAMNLARVLAFLVWTWCSCVAAVPQVSFYVTDSLAKGKDIYVNLVREDVSDTDVISCPLYCNGDRCPSIIKCQEDSVCRQLELVKGTNETSVNITTLDVGHIKLFINCTDEVIFQEIGIFKAQALFTASFIIGWTYFAAWSLSFYPQVIVNWRRKSVVGLNFDFVGLNLLGFAAYGVFNVALYYFSFFQDLYRKEYPLSSIPVELNDVFFSVHAVILMLVVIVQCLMYERGEQTIALWALSFMSVAVAVSAILLILAVLHQYSWLRFVYFFSYLKLVITIIKYVPQAWLNYQRKSTVGWSIHNIFLDFTGGVLSIGQMFLLSVNFNDWQSTFGNPTKLGLGLFSIMFDILFITQHYWLYRHPRRDSQQALQESDNSEPILG